jgi:PAS domain S-box-containing protein
MSHSDTTTALLLRGPRTPDARAFHPGPDRPARRRARQIAKDRQRLSDILAAQQVVTAAGLDLEEVLSVVAERVRHLLGAGGVAVALAEGDVLVYRAACGSGVSPVGFRTLLDARHGEEWAETAKMWRLDGADPPGGVRSLLSMPLHHNQKLVALLEAASPVPSAFGEGEVHALQVLEGFLAAALANAAQHQVQRQLLAERTAALHEAEERFRSVFDCSPVGMARVALDGRFLQVNPALCGMLGFAEPELLATALPDLTHPDDRDANLDFMSRALLGGIRSYPRERFRNKWGQTVSALTSASLVSDAHDQPLYLVIQFQSVVPHKQLKEEYSQKRQEAAGQRPDPGPAEFPTEWSSEGWFYKSGGAVVGPVSRASLQGLVAAGRVRETDPVWERWRLGNDTKMVLATALAACAVPENAYG